MDSKGIDNQGIIASTLAQRIVSPTFFEVEGWRRVLFFTKTLRKFGFDPKNVSLTFEKVELPISIGNFQIFGSTYAGTKTSAETFLVKNRLRFLFIKLHFRMPFIEVMLLLLF